MNLRFFDISVICIGCLPENILIQKHVTLYTYRRCQSLHEAANLAETSRPLYTDCLRSLCTRYLPIRIAPRCASETTHQAVSISPLSFAYISLCENISLSIPFPSAFSTFLLNVFMLRNAEILYFILFLLCMTIISNFISFCLGVYLVCSLLM